MARFCGARRRSGVLLVPGACIVSVLLALLVLPAAAWAGLLLGAELKLSYEDNVVGLLSDQQSGGKSGPAGMPMQLPAGNVKMGRGQGPGGSTGSVAQSKGDFSASLYAEGGGYHDVGDAASVFAKAFAGHTGYNTDTDFNTTVAGAGAGIGVSLGSSVSARAMVLGKIKRFGVSDRDSTAYGGNLILRERLSSSFLLGEFGEYEKDNADSSVFSYTGTKVGAEAGYVIGRRNLLSAGFSYLDQKFEEPPGAEMKTRTIFVSGEHAIVTSWSVVAEYDHQASDTNDGGSATDNIFSVAVRYRY